jgi:hypothetical protein
MCECSRSLLKQGIAWEWNGIFVAGRSAPGAGVETRRTGAARSVRRACQDTSATGITALCFYFQHALQPSRPGKGYPVTRLNVQEKMSVVPSCGRATTPPFSGEDEEARSSRSRREERRETTKQLTNVNFQKTPVVVQTAPLCYSQPVGADRVLKRERHDDFSDGGASRGSGAARYRRCSHASVLDAYSERRRRFGMSGRYRKDSLSCIPRSPFNAYPCNKEKFTYDHNLPNVWKQNALPSA